MITNLIIGTERRACTYRDFQTTVRFKFAGKTFEMVWSFFADADLEDPETIASITERTEAIILETLDAAGIKEAPLADGPAISSR